MNEDRKHNLLFAVLIFVLAFMVFTLISRFILSTTGNYEIPLFRDLVDFIKNVPIHKIPYINVDQIAVTDFGIFTWAKPIVNFIAEFCNIGYFLMNGISTFIQYFYYVFKWVLGFPVV